MGVGFAPVMDVSCPRCKTEYEFDDARVPDSGVTVKCTSCNHVFRVRKKSAPSASAIAAAAITAPAAPPVQRVSDETIPAKAVTGLQPAVREWKVRQPSGNIFSFKELTTLQKWIVERKVSRDDEISLTGEAWKRLGNIAELASFFQVVDDAKKVQELEALQQMQGKVSTKPEAPSAPPPPPAGGPPPLPPSDDSSPELLPDVPPASAPRPSAAEEARRKLTETLREPGFVTLPPKPPEERPAPYRPQSSPQPPRAPAVPEEETLRPRDEGGGAGKWIGMLLLLLGLGGAAGYYFIVYMPEQQRLKDMAEIDARARDEAAAKAKEDEARKEAERVEAARRVEEEKARAAAEAVVDAGAPAVAVVVDAGAVPLPVNGKLPDKVGKAGSEKTPEVGDKPAPKRNADYYIAQGDRLRDKERAEAALDAYGKALDINPDNIEALTGKGLCYLDMAKPVQAEPVLEQALKMNPRYAPAIMGLAESYRFQGKKESAVNMYQKYIDTFPNGPEAGVARSNIERLK